MFRIYLSLTIASLLLSTGIAYTKNTNNENRAVVAMQQGHSMTLEEAYELDEPFYIYFDPAEPCPNNPCLQSAMVEAQIRETHGDAINFVYFPVVADTVSGENIISLPQSSDFQMGQILFNCLSRAEVTAYGFAISDPYACLIEPRLNYLVTIDFERL